VDFNWEGGPEDHQCVGTKPCDGTGRPYKFRHHEKKRGAQKEKNGTRKNQEVKILAAKYGSQREQH